MRKITTTIAAMAVAGMVQAGQVKVLSDQIQFRDYETAGYTTYHYGNLSLSGGSHGFYRGKLQANQVYVGDYMSWYYDGIPGTIYAYGHALSDYISETETCSANRVT